MSQLSGNNRLNSYLSISRSKSYFMVVDTSVVLVPQDHISLVLVLVLHFEIILVSISSSIPSSQ